jgi:hypothetical protein
VARIDRIVKLAADHRGEIIAVVEKRGGFPAHDATVHVYDGTTFSRLASFEGPKLSHIRVAVRGDRVVVGDYGTGMVVGFGLDGNVAWGPISVPRETLYSLEPSLDGEQIYARVVESGVVRRVHCIDVRAGTFLAEQTAVFSRLPFNIGKMFLAACWSEGVMVVSGWAEDANAHVSKSERKFEALPRVKSTPLVGRLIGLTPVAGAPRILWQREDHFVDLSSLRGGGVVGLISNEGMDELTRESTSRLATSSLLRIDPLTGTETARVELGAALAGVHDASLFAWGTKLVATDGSIRDTANGAIVGQLC